MKYLIAALLLTGCITSDKATNYLKKEGKLPAICAIEYPPKTEYKPGQVIIKSDTVYQKGDSIDCPPVIYGRDTIRLKAKCPDNTHITDTIYRVDTTIIENTARIVDLQNKLAIKGHENKKLKEDNADLRRQRNWAGGILISLCVCSGIFLFILFKSK